MKKLVIIAYKYIYEIEDKVSVIIIDNEVKLRLKGGAKRETIQYNYAFSVMGGVVKEVFLINKWEDSDVQEGRLMFIGEIAKNDIRSRFIGKTIPEYYRKQGMASPVLFSKN